MEESTFHQQAFHHHHQNMATEPPPQVGEEEDMDQQNEEEEEQQQGTVLTACVAVMSNGNRDACQGPLVASKIQRTAPQQHLGTNVGIINGNEDGGKEEEQQQLRDDSRSGTEGVVEDSVQVGERKKQEDESRPSGCGGAEFASVEGHPQGSIVLNVVNLGGGGGEREKEEKLVRDEEQ